MSAQEPPRVRVLGIAQDGGHPQAGCMEPCCAPAWLDPGRGHRVASLGLVQGTQRWLVDCTPDLPDQLRLVGGPPLDGILLTHAHMGHYTGLLHLGPEAWAPSGIAVYVMPGMRAFLEGNAPWSALISGGHVRLVDLAADRPLRLTDQLQVIPWEVPHRGPWTETVAFVIQGPSRRVLFVPDIDRWEGWPRDIADVLSEVDVAYVDGSFFDMGELPRRDRSEILHPLVRETMDRLQSETLRSRVRFLHLNHTNPMLSPGSSAWREVHDRGFRIAVEGEEVEL
ncbi:MAG TPA: MBL fold metallo-hydrolase [Deltaproteobacteria bacterium]|nr:MBL fold metallo-hydrolase [Deltaproteobacteria bacterium]